jgi:hypothetical protein
MAALCTPPVRAMLTHAFSATRHAQAVVRPPYHRVRATRGGGLPDTHAGFKLCRCQPHQTSVSRPPPIGIGWTTATPAPATALHPGSSRPRASLDQIDSTARRPAQDSSDLRGTTTVACRIPTSTFPRVSSKSTQADLAWPAMSASRPSPELTRPRRIAASAPPPPIPWSATIFLTRRYRSYPLRNTLNYRSPVTRPAPAYRYSSPSCLSERGHTGLASNRRHALCHSHLGTLPMVHDMRHAPGSAPTDHGITYLALQPPSSRTPPSLNTRRSVLSPLPAADGLRPVPAAVTENRRPSPELTANP